MGSRMRILHWGFLARIERSHLSLLSDTFSPPSVDPSTTFAAILDEHLRMILGVESLGPSICTFLVLLIQISKWASRKIIQLVHNESISKFPFPHLVTTPLVLFSLELNYR